MKVVALLGPLAVVLCVAVPLDAVFQDIADYSWRNYYGEAPKSALRVNKDDCSEPIYVGLGWFQAGLLPAGLYGKSTELVATADSKLQKTSKNPMILCTRHPQLYSWEHTTSKDFEDLKKRCELVVGGVETGETMYIGRQNQDGKVTIGKVYKYPARELVLPANNPQNEKRYTEYEVLTFNCKKPCAA